jgi:t-SNARE complex subunit (syntaxin)
MADEHSEKMVQLLEEIRDLTKLRNDKLETLAQDNRKRGEEWAERQEAQQAEVRVARLAAKKRFYIGMTAVGILIVILCIVLQTKF